MGQKVNDKGNSGKNSTKPLGGSKNINRNGKNNMRFEDQTE